MNTLIVRARRDAYLYRGGIWIRTSLQAAEEYAIMAKYTGRVNTSCDARLADMTLTFLSHKPSYLKAIRIGQEGRV